MRLPPFAEPPSTMPPLQEKRSFMPVTSKRSVVPLVRVMVVPGPARMIVTLLAEIGCAVENVYAPFRQYTCPVVFIGLRTPGAGKSVQFPLPWVAKGLLI